MLYQVDEEEISPTLAADWVEHFKGTHVLKAYILTGSDKEILQELVKAEKKESI